MAPTTAFRPAETNTYTNPVQANPVRKNPIQTLGMIAFIPYLFALYSRIFEIKFASLHITKILVALLIILVPATTRALDVLKDKYIGRYLLAFTMWGFFIIPFAIWRGGAYRVATQNWLTSATAFLIIACMVGSLADMRRAFYTMGIAIAFLAIAAHSRGSLSTGRLTLEHGLFANPNELAMAVLMGLPFMMFMIMEGNVVVRLLGIGGLIPAFWALIHTGSRGGLLGFVVVVIFLFFRCSIIGKVAVAIGGVIVFSAALALLPAITLARYLTMFAVSAPSVESQIDNPGGDPRLLAQAAGSAAERKEILIYSVHLSFRHPLTGVGMGNFPAARDKDTKDRPYHVPWLGTHNAYTQVSSETGLVGFVFYMGAFFGALVLLQRTKKFAASGFHPQSKMISRMVFCLQTSLVSYAVTSFFDHVAYEQMFPTLAGLILALGFSIEPEFGKWLRKEKPAEPAAQPPAGRSGYRSLPNGRPLQSFPTPPSPRGLARI